MLEGWHKMRLLSAREWRWLIQALCLLPLNALAIRWLGARRWQTALAHLTPRDAAAPANTGQAPHIARLVRIAAERGPFAANCLQHSLALWWLLQRQGLPSELKIGVRLANRQCEAHAWVEHAGQVLNDSEDVRQRFAPFEGTIFPAGTRFQ